MSPLAGPESAEPEVPRLEPLELRASLLAGEPVCVLDTRPAPSYRAEHVTEARSLPLRQLEARLGELPADARLVFY